MVTPVDPRPSYAVTQVLDQPLRNDKVIQSPEEGELLENVLKPVTQAFIVCASSVNHNQKNVPQNAGHIVIQ